MKPARYQNIRGILFDKDGTVLDYWKTWVPINRRVALFAARGDEDLARKLLVLGGHDPETDTVASGSIFAAGTADELGLAFVDYLGGGSLPDLVAGINSIFRDGGAEMAVAERGARAAIECLSRSGIACGLATNDTKEGMNASLERAGLEDLFTFKIASDCGHGAKPEPGMANAFADVLGYDATSLAVVGDSVHDLEMARRAGFGLKIGVLSGPGRASDLRPIADVIIPSVRDLPVLFGLCD